MTALDQIETNNRPPETPMSVLSMTSPMHAAPATSTSLATLLTNDPFCHQMQERVRARRARQDETVGDLKVQIRRLEAALQAETKRRIKAVQDTQNVAEERLSEVQEQLQKSWKAQQDITNERLECLESRIATLEGSWKQEHATVVSAAQDHYESVQTRISEMKQEMQTTREERIEREGQLLKRLEGVAEESTGAWQEARQERLGQTEALNNRLQRYDANVESHVHGLENTLRQELAKLQGDLQREEHERMTADEQICAALNRYTETLQTSLALVSGV